MATIMHMKRFILRFAIALSALAVTVSASGRAEAGKCSVSCELSSCSASSWFKKVYCYCSGGSYWGYAICGTGSPLAPEQPVEARGASASVTIAADEEQLLRLEETVLRAYAMGLYDVGDAASGLYEGLLTGNAELYLEAGGVYEDALFSLSDEEWERLAPMR